MSEPQTHNVVPESCWVLRDWDTEQREIPLWRLELHDRTSEGCGYDLYIQGPQGLTLAFLGFSQKAVDEEWHEKRGMSTHAWDLVTADDTPVCLACTEGRSLPPLCQLSIGAEENITCDIPTALFHEFTVCMAVPITEWAKRDGWAPCREVNKALIDWRVEREQGMHWRN
jgi:hypothetical protein